MTPSAVRMLGPVDPQWQGAALFIHAQGAFLIQW